MYSLECIINECRKLSNCCIFSAFASFLALIGPCGNVLGSIIHVCGHAIAYFAIILRENMVFCTSDKYAVHNVLSFGIFRSLFKISGLYYCSVRLTKMSCNILQRKKVTHLITKYYASTTFVLFQIDTHILGILILSFFSKCQSRDEIFHNR